MLIDEGGWQIVDSVEAFYRCTNAVLFLGDIQLKKDLLLHIPVHPRSRHKINVIFHIIEKVNKSCAPPKKCKTNDANNLT